MSGPPSPSFHRAHHRSNPYRSRPSASYYANNPLFDMYTPYWRYTRSIFSTYAPEESSIRGSTAYDYGRSDGDGGRYWRARSPETAAQADAEHPRYLTLAEEFNGILTYINPTTNYYYAFCRSESPTTPPTFLPALSRILYGTSIPEAIVVYTTSSPPPTPMMPDCNIQHKEPHSPLPMPPRTPATSCMLRSRQRYAPYYEDSHTHSSRLAHGSSPSPVPTPTPTPHLLRPTEFTAAGGLAGAVPSGTPTSRVRGRGGYASRG